jgi:hypothetical protein
MGRFGQSLHDVARLMDLTALNGDVAPEACTDRFGKGLRAVDDEKALHSRIEAAFDEIVDQRLNGCGVFRGPLDDTRRMLVAIPVDADRRGEGHVRVHVNAVDLDHQQVEAGKIRRRPFLQPRCRQSHETSGSRRF